MRNLSTILPFYDAVTEQYRYREDVEVQPCIVVMNTTFIPFIIRRLHTTGTVADLTLTFYDLDGSVLDTKTNTDTKCTISTGTTYDYIYYSGNTFSPVIPTGAGYLKVTDASSSADWFSETYMVVSSVSEYLQLDFSSETILAGVKANFSQKIYLNTTLKTPEYLREDTGDKRDGLLVREKQVTMKSYNARPLTLPEYVIDSLVLLPMMDTVEVTTQGGDKLVFSEVRIKDPEWNADTYGSRAKLEIQFIKDVVVKKLSYRETGYTGDDTMAIIKQDTGLTVLNGDVYELVVVFAEDMPDADYTPAAYLVGTSALGDVQLPVIPESSITASGFTIQTLVECNVRWTAIKV